jgi:hypothetical protein
LVFWQEEKEMSFLRRAQVALLLVLVSASVLFAQTATGEVNGTITDPNGAAVPGAAVTLTNQATRISVEAKTSETGTSFS